MVGKRAQQRREASRFGLRLRHADGLETKGSSGRHLRQPPQIGRDDSCDLGVPAAGAAIRHQDDRRTVAGHLDAAVDGAVGDDVVAVEMLDDRTFQALPHAIDGLLQLPFVVDKQRL